MLMTEGGRNGLGKEVGRKGFLESTFLQPIQRFIPSNSPFNICLPHIRLRPSLWGVSASAGLGVTPPGVNHSPLSSR